MYQSIKSRIVMIYIITTVLGLLLSSILIYNQQRNRLLEIEIDNTLDQTILQSELISVEIEEIFSLLDLITSNKVISEQKPEEIIEQLKILEEIKTKHFINIIHIDETGKVLDIRGKVTSVTDREYFIRLREQQAKHVISKPIQGKLSKEKLIVIASAIQSEHGEFKGAVAVAIELNNFYNIHKNIALTHDSYYWIIDKEGEVLAHPENPKDEKMSLDSIIGDLVLKKKYEINDIFDNKNGHLKFTDKKNIRDVIITYSDIPDSDSWKLGVVMTENSILKDVRYIVWLNVLTGVIIILFMVAVSRYLIAIIIKPIEDLTHRIDKSMRNNFEVIEDVDFYFEFKHIINVYNGIVRKNKSYMNNLEKLVEQRTDELNVKNAELLRMNEGLHDLATYDYLTHLYNRHELYKQLTVIHKAILENEMSSCSVLFLDLDHFKYYNDQFGHDMGDRILRYMADTIKNHIKSNDFVARYGGDEFVIVLPDVGIEEAEAIKHRLIKSIDDKKGLIEELSAWLSQEITINQRQALGVSIGVSYIDHNHLKTIDQLINEADAYMYRDKKTGR